MAANPKCLKEWLTTKSKVVKVNYRWEIPEFVNKIQGNFTTNSVVEGHVIDARGTKSKLTTYWKLQMTVDMDGFLCVGVKQCSTNSRYASHIDSQTQACLAVCISAADDTGGYEAKFPEVSSYFEVVGQGLSSRLIRRDILLKGPQRYLKNGKLNVLCAIHYLEPGIYAVDQTTEPSPVVPPPEIALCMQKVLTKGQFSDIVVVVGEHQFPAHRAILAQRSDVFQAMFDAKMKERRTNRVEIQDMSADAVSDLLTFIYTDSAPNVDVNALELLAAAEKYNIPRLKAVCEAQMAKCLDIKNVIDVLIQSEMYKAMQLRSAAIHWIARHAPDVVEMEAWKDLCKDHPQIMEETCAQFAYYIKELKGNVSVE